MPLSLHLEHRIHKERRYILMRFHADDDRLHETARALPDARYGARTNCWLVPNSRKHLNAIFTAFKGLAWIETDHFFGKKAESKARHKAANTAPKAPDPEPVQELVRYMVDRRYAQNTIQTYRHCFLGFLAHYNMADPLTPTQKGRGRLPPPYRHRARQIGQPPKPSAQRHQMLLRAHRPATTHGGEHRAPDQSAHLA